MKKATKPTSSHPQWVTKHKQSGTEIKKINGRYYLYAVTSRYDKSIGRAKKISLGILGSISETEGFIPSEKKSFREKAGKTYSGKEAFAVEYGYAFWLMALLEDANILPRLQTLFPDLWQFIVSMVYCRTAYQSPLKNVPFHLEHADICQQLGWEISLSDQKMSDFLFNLGTKEASIHAYLEPSKKNRTCVLVDATDIVSHSKNIPIVEKGYNARMDFSPQFVLLYLYDAATLQPLYYRIIAGNIREVTAMKNTIAASGIQQCIFIADKGFFSENNIASLEAAQLQYIIPLRRGNKHIAYNELKDIELGDNHFEYAKRHIFFTTPSPTAAGRTVCLYLDGMLKEQEKNDYLSRISSVPEYYDKEDFKNKVGRMGTLGIIHNTSMNAEDIYLEYKQRGDIEQFFDQLKNTLSASSSYMQREESLKGWMFINHISMEVIYKIYQMLKTTPLNKKQNLNHKYSIADTIAHMKTIKKIRFSQNEFIITETDKMTRILLDKLKISIT